MLPNMLFVLLTLLNLSFAINLDHAKQKIPKAKTIRSISNYAPLTKRYIESPSPYNAVLSPSNQEIQLLVEVKFNNVPRSLLIDTGSADTWMLAPHYQCLDAKGKPVSQSTCAYGDPYTGPPIPQINNQTYYQLYGTGEIVTGPIGCADVTIAGLTVPQQKVALVDTAIANGAGDSVRSGVIGLAPRAITMLYPSDNASTSATSGDFTTYPTVFENMYGSRETPIDPLFSFAIERGPRGGYFALGGLPDINFTKEFVSTPFKAISFNGTHDRTRYYPIQPDGYELDGVMYPTEYRTIVDTGTATNRLPKEMADRINGAFDPPAVFSPDKQLYITTCNATTPEMGITISGKTFHINRADMFLPAHQDSLCATTITVGFPVPKKIYPDGFYAFGDAFLKNVVAVFDVGAGEMQFAPHSNY